MQKVALITLLTATRRCEKLTLALITPPVLCTMTMIPMPMVPTAGPTTLRGPAPFVPAVATATTPSLILLIRMLNPDLLLPDWKRPSRPKLLLLHLLWCKGWWASRLLMHHWLGWLRLLWQQYYARW